MSFPELSPRWRARLRTLLGAGSYRPPQPAAESRDGDGGARLNPRVLQDAQRRLRRALAPPPAVFMREGDGVRYLAPSPRRHLALAAAGFAGFALLLVGLFAYLMQSDRMDERSVALAEAEASNQFLLSTAAPGRGADESRPQNPESDIRAVQTLAERIRAFQDSVAAAQARAGADERARLAALQETAGRQVQELDTALRTMEGRGSRLKSSLGGIEAGPQGARPAQLPPAAAKNQPAPATANLAELERRMAALKTEQRDLLARLADGASVNIGRAEQAIRVSGMDLDKLLGDLADRQSGRGGPFVPLAPEAYSVAALPDANPGTDDARRLDRLETLQRILKSMPLGTPMRKYEVVSGFGARSDPFTGRPAMHYGLDFIGAAGSAIRATAPGTVSFVGWKAAYGKTVEIDHGMGFRTRYAHLNKIAVVRGQDVKPGDIVGEMGSTGRSTGAHLHYEVLFNDQPRDPMRFIRAGSHVLDKS